MGFHRSNTPFLLIKPAARSVGGRKKAADFGALAEKKTEKWMGCLANSLGPKMPEWRTGGRSVYVAVWPGVAKP
jgi:hypothetical protein